MLTADVTAFDEGVRLKSEWIALVLVGDTGKKILYHGLYEDASVFGALKCWYRTLLY